MCFHKMDTHTEQRNYLQIKKLNIISTQKKTPQYSPSDTTFVKVTWIFWILSPLLDFACLWMVYQWKHITCGLLCLDSTVPTSTHLRCSMQSSTHGNSLVNSLNEYTKICLFLLLFLTYLDLFINPIYFALLFYVIYIFFSS